MPRVDWDKLLPPKEARGIPGVPVPVFIGPFPLKDLIDVDELVTRHKTDLSRIKVYLDSGITASAVAEPWKMVLSINPYAVMSWRIIWGESANELLYILLAHETAHLTQPAHILYPEEVPSHHADRKAEMDATYWEGLQAAKFGWSREKMDKVLRMFGPARERAKWATLPAMSRRAVRVHAYRRHR